MKPNAPQLISIDLIDDHPHNPRPEIKPEDVANLVGVMGESYSPSHAIRVRQIGERYQIIAGHRRTAAAKIKGHREIWCIVEVMGREKAFMELVRDNAQRELDPIYVGIHAHLACDVAELKGGVAEYARQIGRDRTAVSRLRAAGQVAKACHVTRLPDGISRQLYEISRMPEPCWQGCVDWLVGLTADQRAERMGTAKDVNSRVSQAVSLELPEDVRGTGKELTARMNVFIGRGVQQPSPVAETPVQTPVQTPIAAPAEPADTATEVVATEEPRIIDDPPVQSHTPQPVVESHSTIASPAMESPAPVHDDIPFGGPIAGSSGANSAKPKVYDDIPFGDPEPKQREKPNSDDEVGEYSGITRREVFDYISSDDPQPIATAVEIAKKCLLWGDYLKVVQQIIEDMTEEEARRVGAIVSDGLYEFREQRYQDADDAGKKLINAQTDVEDAVTIYMSDSGKVVAEWSDYVDGDTRESIVTAVVDSVQSSQAMVAPTA